MKRKRMRKEIRNLHDAVVVVSAFAAVHTLVVVVVVGVVEAFAVAAPFEDAADDGNRLPTAVAACGC